MALKTIYDFAKRPKQMVDKFVEENKDAIFEDMKEFVKTELQTTTENIQAEIEKTKTSIQQEISDFRDFTCKENAKLLQELGIDRKTLKIIIHRAIEDIYEGGIEEKALTKKDRQHMHDLYRMYVVYEGNGYITNLVNQMNEWDTI